MSQSILQNGYAILLANTSDLDKNLLQNEQLLKLLSDVREEKTLARDKAIEERLARLEEIDTYLAKVLMKGTNSEDVDKFMAAKAQLESIIARLRNQNTNATYDDVRNTHAFFINTTFKPMVSVAYGYSSVSTNPLPIFGSSVRLKVPIYGDFISDQAIHIRLSELKADHPNNKVRWYDFIGHRMIKEVRLVMNGVILDRYGTEEMEMYYRFHVSKDQRIGWMRCVGQETPKEGTFLQDPEKQNFREKKMIYDGLQTPKQSHDEADLYIPLLFWYNLDPAFAISNWNITYDKFFVEIDFMPYDRCTAIIDYADDGGKYKQPSILACDLISNHVYTTPEVAELFRHRSQFSIIRIHKRVERLLNQPYAMVNISDIKHAVENLYVRFRPVEYERDENASELWRYNDRAIYREIKYASIISTAGTTTLAYTPAYYYETEPVVDSLAIESNGSTIYDHNPGVFYNSYIPLRFGGERIMTPTDDGAYLLTFSINPGESQPSGYLNFSKTPNQYLMYRSSYIDSDHEATVSLSATCINFLYTSPGTMSLRYAT